MLRRALRLARPELLRPQYAHSLANLPRSSRLEFHRLCSTMSTAPHPVHSTAAPADLAAPISIENGKDGAAAPPAPKKEKKEKKPKKGDLAQGMAALELDPKPQYIDSRIEMFDRLKKEYDEKVASESPLTLSEFLKLARLNHEGLVQACPAKPLPLRCPTAPRRRERAGNLPPCRSHSASARVSQRRL